MATLVVHAFRCFFTQDEPPSLSDFLPFTTEDNLTLVVSVWCTGFCEENVSYCLCLFPFSFTTLTHNSWSCISRFMFVEIRYRYSYYSYLIDVDILLLGWAPKPWAKNRCSNYIVFVPGWSLFGFGMGWRVFCGCQNVEFHCFPWFFCILM